MLTSRGRDLIVDAVKRCPSICDVTALDGLAPAHATYNLLKSDSNVTNIEYDCVWVVISITHSLCASLTGRKIGDEGFDVFSSQLCSSASVQHI